MRFLGFLFIIVLILGVVGAFRGWYSVTTNHADDKTAVTVNVDDGKIREDGKAAASRLGDLTAKAGDKAKTLGHKASADESEIEGTVTAVDATARDLTVNAGSRTLQLHVPPAVTISRDGESVAFDQLRPAARARFSFKQAGDDRTLSRIEIVR